MYSNFSKRLLKDLKDIQENPIIGIEVIKSDTFKNWEISLEGAKQTLYENEKFTLKFVFTKDYPIHAPEVSFVKNIPIHPHIYSNGHICIDILYDKWR